MKYFTSQTLYALTLALALLNSAAQAGGHGTLYGRLGGEPVVRSIADTLIERVAADPRLGRSFKGAKIPRIKDKLFEQLCELSGGPCKYTGDSMRETHGGHHITEAEFYGLVDTLRAVLREHHERLADTNELLRLLAPMKRDIVEGPEEKSSANRRTNAE